MASEATRRRRQTPTQARAARRERRNRRTRLKRILALVAVGGVSGLFLIALFIPQGFGGGERALPEGPGVRQVDQGRQHVPEGGSHDPYNSNPPTSGWHYDRWASWGIKNEPLRPEVYIHNMEHGGIILHYNCPDGCPNEVEQMKQIMQDSRNDEIILMPNPEMESRFAFTAWNWLLTLEEYDDDLAREFVNSHIDSPNAPEWQSR